MLGGRAIALWGAAVVCAGCATSSSIETASTIGKGHFQIGAEPGVQYGGLSGFPQSVYPHVDVAFRYGLSDRIDLGVRTGFSLLDLKFKYLFTDPANPDLAVAFGPQLGGVVVATKTNSLVLLRADLPLLIGIKVANGSELVFGPRLMTWFLVTGDTMMGSSATLVTVGPGVSIGYAFKLGETFRLMPEIALAFPIGGAVQEVNHQLNASGAGTLPLLPVFQVKVGLLFGRSGPTEGLPPPQPVKDPNELTTPPPPPPVTQPGGDPNVPPPPATPPMPPPSGN